MWKQSTTINANLRIRRSLNVHRYKKSVLGNTQFKIIIIISSHPNIFETFFQVNHNPFFFLIYGNTRTNTKKFIKNILFLNNITKQFKHFKHLHKNTNINNTQAQNMSKKVKHYKPQWQLHYQHQIIKQPRYTKTYIIDLLCTIKNEILMYLYQIIYKLSKIIYKITTITMRQSKTY